MLVALSIQLMCDGNETPSTHRLEAWRLFPAQPLNVRLLCKAEGHDDQSVQQHILCCRPVVPYKQHWLGKGIVLLVSIIIAIIIIITIIIIFFFFFEEWTASEKSMSGLWSHLRYCPCPCHASQAWGKVWWPFKKTVPCDHNFGTKPCACQRWNAKEPPAVQVFLVTVLVRPYCGLRFAEVSHMTHPGLNSEQCLKCLNSFCQHLSQKVRNDLTSWTEVFEHVQTSKCASTLLVIVWKSRSGR